MNIVKLDSSLCELNSLIRSEEKSSIIVSQASLYGKFFYGKNEVYTRVTSRGHTIQDFSVIVPSILDIAFTNLRSKVKELLGSAVERDISIAAGIESSRAEPASHMAMYAVHLFALIFNESQNRYLNGEVDFSQGSCPSGECIEILQFIYDLEVSRLHLHGKIAVVSTSSSSAIFQVFVPVSVIVFNNGLTIPFSGYSHNLMAKTESGVGMIFSDSLWFDDG